MPMRDSVTRFGRAAAVLVVSGLAAVAAVAVAVAAAPTDLARAERELATAQRSRTLVADKLVAREAELAHRVRTLYKLTRAGHAPLWADEHARTDLTRRRAVARRLIFRDLEERRLLREELDRADVQAARLVRDVADQAAAAPPTLPARSLLPPVGGQRTGRFGVRLDRATGARLISRGVTWPTIAGAVVSAPFAGQVAHVGPLRGVGNVVLLRVAGDGGITILVTGIVTLDPGVTTGVQVAAGARLGVAGVGKVTLELRRAGRTVDPTPFLAAAR